MFIIFFINVAFTGFDHINKVMDNMLITFGTIFNTFFVLYVDNLLCTIDIIDFGRYIDERHK